MKLSPQEIIREGWQSEYEQILDILWTEIVWLNTNIFLLDKILEHPFDLFETDFPPFWALTIDALYERSVMIVWRVAIDKHSKGLTLEKLRKVILKNVRPECRNEKAVQNLKQFNLEEQLGQVKEKIMILRHNQYAHLQEKWNMRKSAIGHEHVDLPAIKYCRDQLATLLEIMCFGHGRSLYYFEHSPHLTHPPGSDTSSDIEKIFDATLRDNGLINAPEQEPEYWQLVKGEEWIKKALPTINRYRKKFKLPPVK